MSVRLYGSSLLRHSARPLSLFLLPRHPQLCLYSGMANDAGLTKQELEDAIKSRLEAVHTQVTDISGACFLREEGAH
jgi:hypothetical protein